MSGPIPSKENDKRWMKFAVALSEKSQGLSSENPNVGCVVVDSDGNLCGSGFTQPGGRPHAEIEALRNNNDDSSSICNSGNDKKKNVNDNGGGRKKKKRRRK